MSKSTWPHWSTQHFIWHGVLLDIWHAPCQTWQPEFVKSFDKVTYNGRVYNVPHPVEKYLENIYGADWRIPHHDPAHRK